MAGKVKPEDDTNLIVMENRMQTHAAFGNPK